MFKLLNTLWEIISPFQEILSGDFCLNARLCFKPQWKQDVMEMQMKTKQTILFQNFDSSRVPI